MNKTQTISWQPFGKKHKGYIRAAPNNRLCVAEGAIRSGKTISHCIIAAAYLETCPDKIHLASGSSMPNARLNIADCNGFGLEYLFRGRCRRGKYNGSEALFIQTQTGEKILIFAGGGKRNSYQKILGNSYGLWIATEINEHFDCDDSRESFIKVALGRQTAAKQPLALWDLNPCHPSHRIYTEYIDKYKTGLAGGYLYGHFTIADNLSVPEQRRREIESLYTPGSVWYRRDILGERCAPQGLIYQTFADNPQKYLTLNPVYDFIQAGVDFGGHKSAFAFVASGIKNGYGSLTALASERIPAKGIDPDEMYNRLLLFLEKTQNKYGPIHRIYCDSAEQTLINGIRTRTGLPVANSIKNTINNRIKAATALISQNRFFYTQNCTTLVDALCTALYDPTRFEDVRLDNGTSDIDTLDAWEYSWERYIKGFTAG